MLGTSLSVICVGCLVSFLLSFRGVLVYSYCICVCYCFVSWFGVLFYDLVFNWLFCAVIFVILFGVLVVLYWLFVLLFLFDLLFMICAGCLLFCLFYCGWCLRYIVGCDLLCLFVVLFLDFGVGYVAGYWLLELFCWGIG